MQKKINWPKASAILLGLLCIGGAVSWIIPNEVEVPGPEVPVEVPGETVYVDVLVDNENLGLVLDHIYDNAEAGIEYLIDDLDDDEVEQIVDRIVFINEAKILAANYVKAEAADELDKEIVGEVTLDEDDIERIRVQDDDDEVIVAGVDFEDLDADVEVTVKFEQDDVKYQAVFNVEIKDNEIDDLDIISISER